MNFKLLALSFFKSKKIPYYIEESYLYFPCTKCGKQTKMFLKTTDWECFSCLSTGTITHLIEIWNGINNNVSETASFYNPKKERKEIAKRFEALAKKYGQEIDDLYIKMDHYLEHLEKNKKCD